MTGQQQKKAEAPERVPRKGQNDHAEAYELMKRMGAKSYTPLPPDQHRWQGRKGEAPLHRIWSWMVQQTCLWGHRSEYAVGTDHRELHIEHLAADLEIELSNVYRYWKEGSQRGFWRNGTVEEGERRLYLCGSVPIPKGEEKANTICTDNIPAYIANEINKWPSERREKFKADWQHQQEVRKELGARAMAAVRFIADREEDNLLTRYDVKPKPRQKYQKDGETLEQSQARRARFESFVAPIEVSVQIVSDFVRNEKKTSYNGQNGSVQTTASLFVSEAQKRRENPSAGGNSETAVAAGRANGFPHEELKAARALSASGRKAAGEAPKNIRESWPPGREEECKQAETLLFSQIAQMQEAYKHADFARERIHPDRATDRLLVRRLINILGPENAMFFLVWLAGEFKGLDRDSMAKLPGRPPGSPKGPRSVALLIDLAKDYARDKLIKPLGLEGV